MFRSTLACGPSHCPIHLVLVTLEQRDVVSDHQMSSVLKLTFISLLKSALGFGKLVRIKIGGCKIAVTEGKVGAGRDFLPGYIDRSFKSACSLGGKTSQ